MNKKYIYECLLNIIDKEDIKEGLLKYTGAHRRFEFVGLKIMGNTGEFW